MRSLLTGLMVVSLALAAHADEVPRLTAEQAAAAAADYAQYCVLCHGADREGHANRRWPVSTRRSAAR
jgi:cytochrome c553